MVAPYDSERAFWHWKSNDRHLCCVMKRLQMKWERQVEEGKPKASSSCTPPKQVWNTIWRKAWKNLLASNNNLRHRKHAVSNTFAAFVTIFQRRSMVNSMEGSKMKNTRGWSIWKDRNDNMFNFLHWTQLKLSRKLHQLGWNSWPYYFLSSTYEQIWSPPKYQMKVLTKSLAVMPLCGRMTCELL